MSPEPIIDDARKTAFERILIKCLQPLARHAEAANQYVQQLRDKGATTAAEHLVFQTQADLLLSTEQALLDVVHKLGMEYGMDLRQAKAIVEKTLGDTKEIWADNFQGAIVVRENMSVSKDELISKEDFMDAAARAWGHVSDLPLDQQQATLGRIIRAFNISAEPAEQPTKTLAPTLPEPNDGSYITYGEYIQKCRDHGIKPKDRLSGEEFLHQQWGEFLEANALYLVDLRRLDLSLVNRLTYEGGKVGKTTADYVPDIHKQIQYELQHVDKDAIRHADRVRYARRKGRKRANHPRGSIHPKLSG